MYSAPLGIGNVGRLGMGLFHRYEPWRLFMMLTLYMDESGTHGQSQKMVIGALVASIEQWEGFNNEWNLWLSSKGLHFLHGVDLFNRKKQFKRWTLDQIREAVIWAATKTDEHIQSGVVVLLRKVDYETGYRCKPKPRKERLDSQYGVCFRAALDQIVQQLPSLSEGERHEINVVLDAGHRNAPDAGRIFLEAKRSYDGPIKLFKLTTEAKDDFPGLQAVDMIAHSFYRVSESPTMKGIALDIAGETEHRKGVIVRVPLTKGILAAQKERIMARDTARMSGYRKSKP